MRKFTAKVILLAIALTMAMFSTASAMPYGYVRLGRINAKSLVNVRTEPSIEARIVGKLKTGNVVRVIEITKDGWYKIKIRDVDYYIWSDYVDTKTLSRYECIGSYITYFDFYNKDRSYNIRLASQNISVKIEPGQLFKWSEIIGPASKEQGYLLGTVIINNKMSQGYGGGVCQVSSTLYNAALDAGMEIVERHTHALPVDYVPVGKDATVSYGYLDFVFRNTKPYPIQIIGFTGNGFVEVQIYNATNSKAKQKRPIKVSSKQKSNTIIIAE